LSGAGIQAILPAFDRTETQAKYDAKGASDADSMKAIDGVYDSGLKALMAN
jgi:hypothetical protein